MQNAVIFSPNLDGHRQVYVFVLSHALNELGFRIFIACDFKKKIINSSYVEKLQRDNSITFIDTQKYAKNGLKITARELIELQNEHNIDLTIFAEADHHISLFTAQIFKKKYRLKGRTVGIYLRPFYYYEKLGFLNYLRYLRHLNTNWKTDNRLFHEFFLKIFSLNDSALYLDENFVAHHKHTIWLPDVFQQYAETIIKEENADQRIWIERINEFKTIHSKNFFLLYFGTAQPRRGYDALLKLAVEQDACFIHVGLNSENEQYEYNIHELKCILKAEGRLFETNEYISDPICIEHFFNATTHLVLPYQEFYGSSGVMLQALEYGIPVLVPEQGIMGYRVKKHKLGLTYDGSYNSLEEQFEQFKETSAVKFSRSISQYMVHQSVDQLKLTLQNAFLEKKHFVERP